MSATFTIPGVDPTKVSVVLKDPNGQVIESTLQSKGAGTFQIEFQPNQNGHFNAEIYVSGALHDNLPIEVKEEEDASSEVLFKPVTFEQYVEEIGSNSSQVTLILRDPSKNVLDCQYNVKNGNVSLTFLPNQDGTYTAEVYLNRTFLDSFTIDVNSRPSDREKKNKVELDFPVGEDLDPSTLKVIILDPKGKNVDVFYVVKEGTLFISFEPLRGGTHKIQMWILGEMADETEINVRVHQEVLTEKEEVTQKKKRYGVQLDQSATDNPNSVNVVLRGPDGEDVECKFTITDGNVDVKFKSEPKKAGIYVAHIFHNGKIIAQKEIVVDASEIKAEEPKIERKPSLKTIITEEKNPLKTDNYFIENENTALLLGSDRPFEFFFMCMPLYFYYFFDVIKLIKNEVYPEITRV